MKLSSNLLQGLLAIAWEVSTDLLKVVVED